MKIGGVALSAEPREVAWLRRMFLSFYTRRFGADVAGLVGATQTATPPREAGDAVDAVIYVRHLLDGLARVQQSLGRRLDDVSDQVPPTTPAALRVATSERTA